MAYEQPDYYYSVETVLGPDQLLLRSFRGRESVSGLFRFWLEMESENSELVLEQLPGSNATITIRLADGTDRYINGIISRFAQAGRGPRFTRYQAELVPWTWLLTLSSDCRIFQNLTTPNIVTEVFDLHSQRDYRSATSGNYEPREYCVQYNETALDFVSRLLEDEGAFTYFEHESDLHTLVLADDSATFPTCVGGEAVAYHTDAIWTQQNTLTECVLEDAVRVGGVVLDDFNFEAPSTDLVTTLQGSSADASTRRIMEYPAGFMKKSVGEDKARVRLEAEESDLRLLRGTGFCRAFVAGGRFTLEGHYRSELNGDYVLHEVEHEGTPDGYRNQFVARPALTPFRPARRTSRPRIVGPQTAIVVGKQGEEIWTDKYGRVKVQFHWDRVGTSDENSSCWIRVAQSWAGKGWGHFFLPRIGHEVIVEFEEGDPDRPLITGCVYNAEMFTPYTLPTDQTKSTIQSRSSKAGDGYNELRFEDKKGEEEVFFQAERDALHVVKNDQEIKVGLETKSPGSRTLDVHQDRTSTIHEGDETLQVKKGKRTTLVDEGDDIHEIKQGHREVTISQGNDTKSIQQGNREVTLDMGSDTLTIKQGNQTTSIDLGQSTTEAMQKIELKVGANTLTIDQTGVTIKGIAVTIEGTATTDVSAPVTNVSGDGVLALKGGVIKIN